MSDLVKINGSDYGIEETKAKQISALFKPMLDKMEDFEKKYNEIAKKEIDDETCKEAKVLRLEMVKVRTGTAQIHKEQKQFYLQAGRFIDGWKNAQLMASQGLEEKLKGIEDYHENIKKEQMQKLHDSRVKELEKYGVETPGALGAMNEDVWTNYITGVKLNYEARIEAERKAEQERKEAELKRIAEEKAMREENDRLKREHIEAEKKAELERKRIEAERKKQEAERLALEKKAQLEREKAEKERQAIEEKARKEQAEKQAQIDKMQREERERQEAERKRIEAEKAREADHNHRKKINHDALAVLCKIVDESKAKEIITAIAKNEVPHIKIIY